MLNSTKPNNLFDDEPKQKWTPNAKWIIGLLSLLVLLLLSCLLTNYVVSGEGLKAAIQNFSTLLSIVLSISSIAFAGYTSIETSRQYHNMARAVEEIRVSNGIMSENYKHLLRHYHETVHDFSKQIAGNQRLNQYAPDTTSVSINNSMPQQSQKGENISSLHLDKRLSEESVDNSGMES